jgi:hypothetical protein
MHNKRGISQAFSSASAEVRLATLFDLPALCELDQTPLPADMGDLRQLLTRQSVWVALAGGQIVGLAVGPAQGGAIWAAPDQDHLIDQLQFHAASQDA